MILTQDSTLSTHDLERLLRLAHLRQRFPAEPKLGDVLPREARVGVDEERPRRPPRERLDRERAGAAEEIEDGGRRQIAQHGEHRTRRIKGAPDGN